MVTHNPLHRSGLARLFVLLGEFYPIRAGKTMRPVPSMPYLSFPPRRLDP
jgi:hypothetical protein